VGDPLGLRPSACLAFAGIGILAPFAFVPVQPPAVEFVRDQCIDCAPEPPLGAPYGSATPKRAGGGYAALIKRRRDRALAVVVSVKRDADNRLTCATLSGTPCSTPTFVYDSGVAGPGNITAQAGVGTYSYPAPGQIRPHAVTSITGTFNGIVNPTFTYDGNGNMTGRGATANVIWSSYNYPISISASDSTGSEAVLFNYGPDRQRWQQTYTVTGGPTEQTYYIGGLVDLVFSGGTTNYRHYIYAGSEPVAVYSRTAAGAITMSYMLEDHQGGVSAITSNAGTVGTGLGIDESFSAFGQRRNPNTWSGAPLAQDLTTIAGFSRQGYTFQTSLGQSMGLNHMNGRVEDAISGRMMSPDPHVPDPSDAQSYNRYSYVNNNPLTLVDPTGFSAKPCPLANGCPGGVAGLPEQSSWSCYGVCGLGFANTYGTVTAPGATPILFAGSPSMALAQIASSVTNANPFPTFAQQNYPTAGAALGSLGAQSQSSAQSQDGTGTCTGCLATITVTSTVNSASQPSLSYVNAAGGPSQSVWSIQWRLSSPSAAGGYIVQKIHYSTASANMTYWEAWSVAPGAQTTTLVAGGFGYDDSWLGAGTSLFGTESWTVAGTAGFYEGLALPSTFIPYNPDTWAGSLPSTTIDPNLPSGNVIRLYGSGN
jgi:RHS repeat-associated protein